MDLALLYETGFSYLYEIFHYVIANWINNDKLVNINGEDYLNNEERMAKVAHDFKIGSNGVLKGVIGAVDGCDKLIPCQSHGTNFYYARAQYNVSGLEVKPRTMSKDKRSSRIFKTIDN